MWCKVKEKERKKSFWICDTLFRYVFLSNNERKKKEKRQKKKGRNLGLGSENFESFGKGRGIILLEISLVHNKVVLRK